MLLRFRAPTVADLEPFVAASRSSPFSYPEVGASRTATAAGFAPPRGYDWDRKQTQLGQGDGAFQAAGDAVARGRMFEIAWIRSWFPPRPVREGDVVAVAARCGPLWWLNTAQVVYLVDEEEAGTRRRGFAYGTLLQHGEAGEERFVVEQRPDGSVWFDLAAFSRPRHPLVRAGYPLMRGLQARFRRDSAAALQRAVAEAKQVKR